MGSGNTLREGFTLLTVLSVVATMGFLLALAGCGAKSGSIDGGNQTRGEDPLSDATDMAGTLSGTDASEDDFIEGLFGSKGVYWQDLADNGEAINPDDKLDFLDRFGFGDNVPFYVHTEEDGYALMELYYDEERKIGCVILDGENTGNYSYGFSQSQ